MGNVVSIFKNNSMTMAKAVHMKSKYLKLAVHSVWLFALFMCLFTFIKPEKAAAAGCGPTQTFKTVWKTDNAGTTTSTQIRIPTTGTGYSYRVDVNGDGDFADTVGSWNETTNRTGTVTIDFAAPGTYPIAICGTFPRIFINNGGDKDKILTVTQWGDNAWTSMASAFLAASNLNVTATDTPNLTGATSLSAMFRDATSLIGNSSFNNWNTSTITDMSAMFRGAVSFNQPLSSWNTSNVTNINHIFYGASSFNQDINNWDVSKVTNIQGVFRDAPQFNKPLNNWNTGAVTTMHSVFWGATAFNQPIGTWNTSNVTTMNHMFRQASNFNQPIGDWDVSKVTSMERMFAAASNSADPTPTITLSIVPMAFNQDLSGWDTSLVTNMYAMFSSDIDSQVTYYQSIGYTTVNVVGDKLIRHPFNRPLGSWQISNVTNMIGMLSGTSLSVPNYDATLLGWSTQNVQPNIVLGVYKLAYCASANARKSLIDTYNWQIQGDAESCPAPGAVPGVPNTGIRTHQIRNVAAVFVAAAAILSSVYICVRHKATP